MADDNKYFPKYPAYAQICNAQDTLLSGIAIY